MEQECATGELTLRRPGPIRSTNVRTLCRTPYSARGQLRSAETDGSTQGEVLKQVIDRTVKAIVSVRGVHHTAATSTLTR